MKFPKISYNDYPLLYCLSQNKDEIPEELLIEAKSQQALDFVNSSKPLKDIFNYASGLNSLYDSDGTTNYLATENFVKKFFTPDFQQSLCRKFCKKPLKTDYGSILFPDGGQFVYLIIAEKEAALLKNVNGAYLCAAKFRKNFFFGFEEARVKDKKFYFLPEANYSDNSPQGGYLALVMTAIAFSDTQTEVKKYKSQNITQSIYII